MTQSLSITDIIEKNKLASSSAFLVLLDIDAVDETGTTVATLYVVRNTVDVTYQGRDYIASAFDLNLDYKPNEQVNLTLNFQDQTRALQAYMQAYGGGIGFGVTVTVINSSNLTQPPELQEKMMVVGASAVNYVCTFSLGAENNLSKVFPRRMQNRNFCPLKYKGVECGYVGVIASCDRTLNGVNGCTAHGNTLRFGGYPGLNANGRRYA